jgi:hypothetical protein
MKNGQGSGLLNVNIRLRIVRNEVHNSCGVAILSVTSVIANLDSCGMSQTEGTCMTYDNIYEVITIIGLKPENRFTKLATFNVVSRVWIGLGNGVNVK